MPVIEWLSIDQLADAWRDFPGLGEEVAAWVTNVVARPDRRLGRAGPLCPSMPSVLREGTLTVTRLAPATFTNPHALDASLDQIGKQVIAQTSERACALLAFPGIESWEVRACVEFAVERVRPQMVADGAMIGSFHPFQTRRSRHNHEFESMRAPVPLIGVRKLFAFDRPSLLDDPEALLAFDARTAHT